MCWRVFIDKEASSGTIVTGAPDVGYFSLALFALVYFAVMAEEQLVNHLLQKSTLFDVFQRIACAKWDTLFFFHGVILCVGGLGFIGYLTLLSKEIDTGLKANTAHILVGLISAVVDNIPVMYATFTLAITDRLKKSKK